jgi:hypothetical protein
VDIACPVMFSRSTLLFEVVYRFLLDSETAVSRTLKVRNDSPAVQIFMFFRTGRGECFPKVSRSWII